MRVRTADHPPVEPLQALSESAADAGVLFEMVDALLAPVCLDPVVVSEHADVRLPNRIGTLRQRPFHKAT